MLHDEVQDFVALVDGVDRDDVRVAERRGGSRFAFEALDHPLSHREQRRREHLDRHLAIQCQIVGEVDGGHAATSDFDQDLVLAERRAPQRGELRL